jgi:predicted TIM-barrel fold metal-dependent hydrolase
MPPRAIDFHVHLPTPDWLDGSMAGYVEAAEAYFRSSVSRQSLGELAALYRGLEVTAVLLAWDAETATGRPRVANETVAAACRDYPDVFTGLGSVDPHKGEAAVAEVENIAALGLRGVKFHPSLQAFAPDDPQYWPIFAACERHGLLALFHTDISGWAPRRIPAEVIRELRGRLSGQFLWGSDYPFIAPERCLSELEDLDLSDEVMRAVLHDNAARVLGL